MRNYINSQASQHEMKLVQMGADFKQVNSKLCYVKFHIDDLAVSYVYNINAKNKYFLERVKPYPIVSKEFENEEDVIKQIEVDIKQFKNASKSRNIHEFIEINRELYRSMKEFEDLFLYYNVPNEALRNILEQTKEIHKHVFDAQNISKRIFFEKDPENL
jgi:hypothetical protein